MRTAALTPFSFLVVVCLAASGCGSSGKPAAIVNGQVITVKDVDERLASMNPSTRALYADQKDRLLEQMVVEAVLLKEANRRGLSRDAEVRKLSREAERQILVGRLLDKLRQEKQVSISDEQVAQFYESNKDSFMQPENHRVSHILTADEASAKKALDRIKGGEAFAKVAEEVSVDPSKTRGGDIGAFTKGQVIPEFEEAVMKLRPREMSGVVKTPLGYHIILYTEKQEARQRPIEEVQDQIRTALQSQMGQQTVQSAVQELRSKAQIQIKENYSTSPSPDQQPAS